MDTTPAAPAPVKAEAAPAAAPEVPPRPVERYFLTARLERGQIGGKHQQGVVLHGPWRNQINVVGAQARYNLDVTQNPIPPDITDLPPSGQWPGRMNFGGTAQTKRTQMVDRMALRFAKTEDGKCKFEGEGANRVGKYVVTGTGAFREGGWGASQRDAAADEGGARKKVRRGGASAAAQALDQRPTLWSST